MNKWLEEKKNVNSLLLMAVYLILVLLLVSPFIFFFFHNKISYFSVLFILISLELIFGTLLRLLLVTFNMMLHRIRFVLYTNLYFYAGLSLSMVLIRFNKRAVYWILGLMILKIVVFIIAFSDFLIKTRFRININQLRKSLDRKILKSVMIFMLPLYAGTFLDWSRYNFFNFMIEDKFGPELLAIVVLGFSMVVTLSIYFDMVIVEYILPKFYKKMHVSEKNEKSAYFSEIISKLIPVYAVYYIFIIIFSSRIVLLFSNKKYLAASKYIFRTVLIEFLRVISVMFSNVFYVENKTVQLLKSKFYAFIVMLIGLYISIYTYDSVYWVLPVIFLSGIVIFFLTLYYFKGFFKFSFSPKRLFWAVLISSQVAWINMIDFNLTFENNILLRLWRRIVYNSSIFSDRKRSIKGRNIIFSRGQNENIPNSFNGAIIEKMILYSMRIKHIK